MATEGQASHPPSTHTHHLPINSLWPQLMTDDWASSKMTMRPQEHKPLHLGISHLPFSSLTLVFPLFPL